jgi:8-oxo-dGTP pyrophosphatase MutT (NUDIX family)
MNADAGESRWPALRSASAHDPSARVAFAIDARIVGSVARVHLPALQGFAPALQRSDGGVALDVAGPARERVLGQINEQLRARGLIHGWRNEIITLWDADGRGALSRIERAAARFWGTLTLGAHATGYVAGADGRPERIWIAQRAFDKPTDPGLFDNLVGGGVPHGQSPWQTLCREGWEEAGLSDAPLSQAQAVGVLRLVRDIPEGLQHEQLHAFDLPLAADWRPHNQDGEVAAFQLLPVAEAIALASGEAMTVDAALVMLDFAERHRLLGDKAGQVLARRLRCLRVAAFNDSEGPRQGP